MRLGCFGSCSHVDDIKKAGFDSAELDFCEVASMSEAEFAAFSKKAAESGLGFEVFSGLIPLTERFQSEDFDLDKWLGNTQKGAKRVRALGCYMIPFGAGKCRSIPDGVDPDKAKEKVAHIINEIANVLGENGIKLVIEPLGPANSNYLQTLPEVKDFLDRLHNDNCSSMCDLRHMHKNDEPMEDIVKYKDIVKHAHIDYPRGTERYFPLPFDDFDYLPYFHALKEAGYEGLVTVEATAVRKDFQSEADTSSAFLRYLWGSV